MRNLVVACMSIIDKCFSDVQYLETGNKLIDIKTKATMLGNIVETASHLCVDYLNTINPDDAKMFAKTGFINEYVMKKQKEFVDL